MFRWTNLIAAIAMLSVVGCVADDGTDSTEQGDPKPDPEQKTSGYGLWGWQQTTNLPTSHNYHTIGSTSGQTCFLSGLLGTMQSAYGAPEPPNTLYTTAAAGFIGGDDSTYQLEAFSGQTGLAIGMRGVCTDTVASRTKLYYYDSSANEGAVKMAPTTNPKTGKLTICGLVEVYQSGSLTAPQSFASVDDELRVIDGGDGYWYLGGSGNVAGDAQCIDVSARTTSDYSIDGGTINLSSGADKQCFLTGLKGVWQSNDLSSGVTIAYDAGLLQWTMTATDTGKQRGYARCLE
jgi:hypothetical protein